jgi:choline-sulfatase
LTSNVYSSGGFDRGHMCPAKDRSATPADSRAAFFMTNIVPQSPNSNQRGWERLQDYCRRLAREVKALYIACGPAGVGGIGKNGPADEIGKGRLKVTVPAKLWKVVLVLPRADAELREISRMGFARPNILWLCADDFAPSVCGAYGNRQVRTPNLDRLAAEGIRFDRAFCACPLSTPSRQAFWTGRYPRSIGVTLSPTPLPEGEVTIPALLSSEGYETGAVGKTHYYSPRRHEFDWCVDLAEHRQWLEAKGARPLPPGISVLGPWRPFYDPTPVWLNSDCLPYGSVDADMAGTFFALQAEEYLLRERQAPFFLFVSFYEPHAPFHFPIEYHGRHSPGAFAVPHARPDEVDQIPTVFRGLTRAEKQGIIAAYYTSVEHMDKNVGIVLDALDVSGHTDDTLVIFTGDHGYLLGQHGRFEKHCCYEPAVRSAFLMRLPKLIQPGQASSALVELIDIVPTILTICGVTVPGNMQGRSLVRLLRGEEKVHREYVIAEYADNEEAMIRSERWKLVYSTGQRRRLDGYALHRPLGRSIQLYDLVQDPEEATNVATGSKHAATVNELIAQLAEHMRSTARHPELVPKSKDVYALLDHCLAPQETLEIGR